MIIKISHVNLREKYEKCIKLDVIEYCKTILRNDKNENWEQEVYAHTDHYHHLSVS